MSIPDEIVEKAREAYDDAYEVEYLAHGTQGNNLVAMRAALDAVLPDLTATERAVGKVEGLTEAARDVVAERERQQSAEGWTPGHDDSQASGQIALAAACYAIGPNHKMSGGAFAVGRLWPWDRRWWKPKNPRRDLVRAGALILAEIERLDRKAAKERA